MRGSRRNTSMRRRAMMGTITGAPANVNTKYVYGSGVGALSRSARAYQQRRAAFCCINKSAQQPPSQQQQKTNQYQTLADILSNGNSAGPNQIDMFSNRIINCADPTDDQDVATKNYVDTYAQPKGASNGIFAISAGRNIKITTESNSNIPIVSLQITEDVDFSSKQITGCGSIVLTNSNYNERTTIAPDNFMITGNPNTSDVDFLSQMYNNRFIIQNPAGNVILTPVSLINTDQDFTIGSGKNLSLTSTNGNISLNPSNKNVDVMGTLNVHANKIINCADPTQPTDVATKNYVDAHAPSSKGQFIVGNGTAPTIFANPYETALSTTTVYDWTTLAIGQSHTFTTTLATKLKVGYNITITYSDTDSITGLVTSVVDTTITLGITAFSHSPKTTVTIYKSAGFQTTVAPGGYQNYYLITPPISSFTNSTIIQNGKTGISVAGGGPKPYTIDIYNSTTNVLLGASISSTTASLTPEPSLVDFNFASGVYVPAGTGIFVKNNAESYTWILTMGGSYDSSSARSYYGELNGYTLSYSTGTITLNGNVAIVASPSAPLGVEWGVINTPTPTLAQVLTSGAIANNNIDMNNKDIVSAGNIRGNILDATTVNATTIVPTNITGWDVKSIVAGTGVTVSNNSGAVTINSTAGSGTLNPMAYVLPFYYEQTGLNYDLVNKVNNTNTTAEFFRGNITPVTVSKLYNSEAASTLGLASNLIEVEVNVNWTTYVSNCSSQAPTIPLIWHLQFQKNSEASPYRELTTPCVVSSILISAPILKTIFSIQQELCNTTANLRGLIDLTGYSPTDTLTFLLMCNTVDSTTTIDTTSSGLGNLGTVNFKSTMYRSSS